MNKNGEKIALLITFAILFSVAIGENHDFGKIFTVVVDKILAIIAKNDCQCTLRV